jgi:hypothetical protein
MTAFGGHGAMSVSHVRFEIFHEQLLVQPFLVGESPALFFPVAPLRSKCRSPSFDSMYFRNYFRAIVKTFSKCIVGT